MIVDFSKPFIPRKGDWENTTSIWSPQRNCFRCNDERMVFSPDKNTIFFDIVAEVLQGDILTPYVFIICLDYVLWTLIALKNGFTLKKKKARRWRYLTETITDRDYTDDEALLKNTPVQADLQHILKQAIWNTGLHMNANKNEHMCF